MKKVKLHKDFQLNEVSFSSEKELLKYAKKLSKPTFNFLKDWFSTEDYIEVKTSGSTGKPKKIKLKKKFMINSARATGRFFNLKKNTTALLCLPVDYIAGKMMIVRAVTLGWKLDIIKPSSNPLEKINKTYDFSAMVPLQLEHSIASLYKVKKTIVGGGVVSIGLQKKIQNITSKVYATYGMTETITHIAAKKLNNVKVSLANEVTNSFYKILPNVTVFIDDRSCLLIKAPKISKDVIITNDVVELVSDKEFIWLGRYDNVINSGGIKLHPEVIEEKLASLFEERFFVGGVKDDSLGEKLVLLVEGKERDVDFKSVKNISKYEIPKNVYFLDKFIETATNKVQRSKTLALLNL